MALNARPIIFFDNILERGTLSAATAVSGFPVDNIADQRTYKPYKVATAGGRTITVDLNKITNPGLETGDATGWTLTDATVDNTNPASGTWALKLVATGSDTVGADTDSEDVDPLKTYRLKFKGDLDIYASGSFNLQVFFLDAEGNQLSSTVAKQWTAATVGYESISVSVGPTGADVVIPTGTASLFLRVSGLGTPNFTAYMDDVLFFEETDPDSLAVAGHNYYTAGAIISVTSNNSDSEALGAFTTRLANFTVPSDKAFFKEITAVGTAQRAWRVEQTTNNIAVFVGVMVIGERLTMERWPVGDFDPDPELPRAAVSVNDVGSHLGTSILRTEIKTQAQFQKITDSWFTGTFKPAWDEHIGLLKPFFWVWDVDNHPLEVYYVRWPGGQGRMAPLTPTRRDFTLHFESIKEDS